MDVRRSFWNRVGHVEIEDDSGQMIKYYGLDFKFKVKSVGDIYNQFSVSILGLSAKTINSLTVWNPVTAVERLRKIAVYGGYEKTGEELIASGYVWHAIPTSPPEMWLNFECWKYLSVEDEVRKPRELTNKSILQVFNEVAAECGMRPGFYASRPNRNVGSFVIEGKIANLAHKFASRFDLTVVDNAGMLVCRDRNGERGKPENAFLISNNTGLLSTTNIDIVGARITTRLRTDIGLCDWIYLESELIPSASGHYFAIEKELEGHFRGELWVSRYRVLRKV